MWQAGVVEVDRHLEAIQQFPAKDLQAPERERQRRPQPVAKFIEEPHGVDVAVGGKHHSRPVTPGDAVEPRSRRFTAQFGVEGLPGFAAAPTQQRKPRFSQRGFAACVAHGHQFDIGTGFECRQEGVDENACESYVRIAKDDQAVAAHGGAYSTIRSRRPSRVKASLRT